MAVYTQMTLPEMRTMLAIYPDVGTVRTFEGVNAGSINSIFRVQAENGVFYVRISEVTGMRELMYERDLLAVLARRRFLLESVQAPEMLNNVVNHVFYAVDGHKFACVFPELHGRELGVFELQPTHLFQLGAFLARAHLSLRDYRGKRANPFGFPVVTAWIADLEHHLGDRALANRLRTALKRIARARRRPLPRGVIHGDLFSGNTKWQRGQLSAVFDWEMAGRDHLALDIAIVLNAWCWQRPEHRFVPELCAALLQGYQSVRGLNGSEYRGLYAEAQFAALRFCVSRVRDFHLPSERYQDGLEAGSTVHSTVHLARGVERDFLDYRDYEQRLEALEQMGAREFRSLVGLSSVGHALEGLRHA